jgi:cobalt-zinc-cadmium efflux system outer membrane protein
MVFKTLLIVVALLQSDYVLADNCQGQIGSYQEAIKCAEVKSPEVQRAELALERAKKQVSAAGQWQNPEISADSYHGKVGAERASETEIALGVPVELGGKISARTAVAEGDVAKAEAELFQARANVRTNMLLKLHRLRQLLHEQEVIEESISTFSKLVSQYSKRLKLSPEQEVTVTVFRMSKSDYDLKKIETLDELLTIDSFFKISLGTSIEALKQGLPESPKTWPKIGPSNSKSNSPQLRLAQAELSSAQAELSLAQSESWPTLTLGPSVKMQTEAGRSDQLYGFNVSFPIPVFNMNGSGRAAALAGVKLAETGRNFVATEQQRLREEFAKIYQQSVNVLSTSLSHQEIEKKHHSIERLFLQGVVPSALVIEAHRTFVELEKSRNARELKALEVLMNIYTFDGQTPEFIQ